MAESGSIVGVQGSAGHAEGEPKKGLHRHESRHSCQCGESDSAAFYASMTYRCKACQKAKMRAHYKTEGYRAQAIERQRVRLMDETERRNQRARVTLGNAIKTGKIKRPIWCEDCGILGPTHGHHEDYDKPLEVEWLCRSCHAKRHDGYRKKMVG